MCFFINCWRILDIYTILFNITPNYYKELTCVKFMRISVDHKVSYYTCNTFFFHSAYN